MGKDSLLESTSKKKAAAKGEKEKPAKKKTAAKKSSSAKSTAKSKSPAKAKKTAAKKPKKAAASKTTAKKSAAPKRTGKARTPAAKSQKAATKASAAKTTTAKQPTRKELLWKQFDLYSVEVRYSPPAIDETAGIPDAPSFFSGMNASEAGNAKKYLRRQFVWEDIKAAGEQYAAQRAAKEEAKRKAEEDAKRKAEEDAKRKAEEDAKHKAEEDAKRRAEEEAKNKAEEDAKRRAAEQMPPPPAESESHMGSRFNPIKIGIVVFCAIILLLVVSSYSNTKNYYIQEKDGAVEIWRGIFAPMGKTRLMILPGIQMPAEEKEVYGWQDAYRLIYQYYINKADAILEVPGVPDTVALTANLEKAIQYAPNRELADKARSRLVSLRMQTLVQKAQAALNRGTIESAEAAIGFLQQAAQYDLSPAEAEMIQAKIEAAEAVRAEREMARAEAEKAAAEQAALEEETQALREAAENQAPAAEESTH